MASTPEAAASYYRRQQSILLQLLLALRKVWRRMDPKANWSQQYDDDSIGAQLVLLISAAQVAATQDADTYIGGVLRELGIISTASPVLAPKGMAGLTGSGLPVGSLMQLSVAHAGQTFSAAKAAAGDDMTSQIPASFDQEKAAQDALDDAEQFMQQVAATIMADTARAAESAAATAHPEVAGYVRMLTPPSCSRCVILAGKFYAWNDGFQRHPLCDCRHIPVSESLAGDLTVNPDTYFHSLSSAEQNKAFTNAGAQAIRDGADINQVVNARRGMTTAQTVAGNTVTITSTGTTRRGLAYARLGGDRSRDTRAPGERYARTTKVRLMPESIYEYARGDRDEAIRLLRQNGFIL